MHRDNQAGFHIEEVSKHTVVQFGSEDLQKRDRTELFTNAEVLTVPKLKGAWSDKVLYGKSGRSKPIPREIEITLFVHVEHPVHKGKTLFAVQGFGSYAKSLEVIEQIGLNAVETGFCNSHSIRFNAEGQIFGLDKTIIATGKLTSQHIRVFDTDTVEIIPLRRNDNALTVGVLICRHIHKGQLELNRAVEVVKEITPTLKDCRFIFVLIELIVDVLELNGLCEVAGFHTANAVRVHPFKRDGVLCRLLLFILILRSCDGGFDFSLFRSRELSFCGQYDIPPCRVFPVAPVPHRNCRSDTVAVSDAGNRPVRCYERPFQVAVRFFRTLPKA